ncbi:RNA-directed DNA polymerase, eukaryota [Tanacetum coccineum]|uniref:RNA-directed DNA polymerase, eukaryota n=1 Tax=Tanacetum coccineum TaxID=301880 RepID=A0ABQ5EGX1_9ASTR
MGQDIVAAVTEFFSSGKFPPGCNSTFIALIPKIHDAKIIKDFRPISLIVSIYKIIAKILANRLSLVILDLINEVQTTFVPNRQIFDGHFILNELISWCKHKKVNAMIFKVDFKKAFDFIRWVYLDHILKSFGFGDTWRSWISGCLNSAKGSVIINESPTSEFQFYKGLKQEDPLSLFLFILVMESLHRSFSRVMEAGLFKDLESIRRDFFHGADKVDRKMVWVRWEKVLASKNSGGLGVSSLYATSGLFFSNGYGDLSLTVLPSGLVSLKQFMELKETSMFLKKRSADLYARRNGENTLFWEDIWHGDSALKMTHSRLFALELKKDIIVAEKMSNAYLNLSFRRLPRSGIKDEQYKNLVFVTFDVLLPQMHDRWSWSLNASGDFTISMDRLPTRFNLSSCGLEIPSILCPLCNVVVETTSHICSPALYLGISCTKYVVGGNLISLLSTLMSSVGELVVGELVVGELVVGELVVGELVSGLLFLFDTRVEEVKVFTCIRVLEKTTRHEFDEAVPTSFNLERKNIKLEKTSFPDEQKRVSRLINSKGTMEERLEAARHTKISDKKRSRDEFEAVDLLKKPLSSFNLERNNIKVNSEKASFPDEQTRLRLINSKGTMEGLRQQGASLVNDAKRLFLEMEGNHCWPTTDTYNYLLQGYLKNKFYDDVKMILHRMEEKDHYLYETTLSMLRASVAAGSLDATLSKLINKQSLYVS